MSLVKGIDFHCHGDERGQWVPLEIGRERNIPFDIKRVYYIYRTEAAASRGFHAHKALKQVAICISGSCTMVLDNGKQKESILMDCPNKGLLIESMMWREMHDFSGDCVLLVLASEHYDERDYIRNYDDFFRQVDP